MYNNIIPENISLGEIKSLLSQTTNRLVSVEKEIAMSRISKETKNIPSNNTVTNTVTTNKDKNDIIDVNNNIPNIQSISLNVDMSSTDRIVGDIIGVLTIINAGLTAIERAEHNNTVYVIDTFIKTLNKMQVNTSNELDFNNKELKKVVEQATTTLNNKLAFILVILIIVLLLGLLNFGNLFNIFN